MNNRRNFIKMAIASSTAAAVGSAARTRSASSAEANQAEPKRALQAFNYQGVRLLDGMLKKQYDAARDYFFAIPDEDILKGFRQRAGMRTRGNDLGGWYSGDPAVTYWWSKGDTFNTFGQWLSGMARMSSGNGDQAIGDKATHLMMEWGKTIEDDGYFFYSRRPWQPHYIYEKTICGLVDLYEFCGRKDALPLIEKITDWAIGNLDRIRKPDMNTEWYTLSENLYRAYQLTGNPKYRTFADVWQHTAYWKAFTSGSELTRHGHHAYSHVNTLSSAAMAYEVTGDREYLQTIVNAYDWLKSTQFYATGGYGPDEELLPPDGALGKSLETTFKTFETPCGTWAGFKLARYLMQFTGQAHYGDWIEKLVYNAIGAALPMAPKGSTFYYSDYRLGGGRKFYHMDGTWPCCSGTLPQALADYHNLIYFKGPSSLYVNLFVPSMVTWNQEGTEVKLTQETAFPESDTTVLMVQASKREPFDLKFRVPGWSQGASVEINGAKIDVVAEPGQWATIRRTWSSGDRVTIQLSMGLALAPIDKQHPNRVAITYGPVVLVRDQAPILIPKSPNPSGWIVRKGRSLEFDAGGQSHGPFLPFYKVGEGRPYNMYFDLQV